MDVLRHMIWISLAQADTFQIDLIILVFNQAMYSVDTKQPTKKTATAIPTTKALSNNHELLARHLL
jgi:hypothetical protein